MKQIKHKPLCMVLVVYWFISIVWQKKDMLFYQNIGNPLFWASMLIYFVVNKKNYIIRFCNNRKYLYGMFLLSAMHMIIYFYFGFFFGFSKSPYSHTIVSIGKNIIVHILPIVGIEVTRSIIIVRNKNQKGFLCLFTLLCIFLETKYSILFDLRNDKEQLFQYIFGTVLPFIACHFLCTYLSLKGSYSVPLVYRVGKELMVIGLPIFPDMDWFISGSFHVVSLTIIYFVYQYKLVKEPKARQKTKETFFTKWRYRILLLSCILLISFMLGAFPYEPIVVFSNSMSSVYSKGDVIIFKKRKEKELKEIPENTIIIYQIGERTIAHRVVQKIKKKEEIYYQTKGDNNNVVDKDLVEIKQIKGVYVFSIKYIGFPSVWLYQYFHTNKTKAEAK